MLYYEMNGYGFPKYLCEDILCWFAKSFYPRHKIDITVNHRGLKREGVYGWCDIMENERRPRTFLIEIQSNLDKRTYAETLVHELIHVGQWIDGDLTLKKGSLCYRGIVVGPEMTEPHEVEAYEGERDHLLKFMCDSGRVWTGL
tara:strand:- start:8252 stop:8683 length:432 start_codon:yes stop_codon:yes gene_type:complete